MDLVNHDSRAAPRFCRSFGRKGSNAGEFLMPQDVEVIGERIFVADTSNDRVQILERATGMFLGFVVTRHFEEHWEFSAPRGIARVGPNMIAVSSPLALSLFSI